MREIQVYASVDDGPNPRIRYPTVRRDIGALSE